MVCHLYNMGFFTLLSTSLMSFVGCADLLKFSQDIREKVNHLIQAFTNKNNNQTDTEENRQIDCSELPSKIMTREIITRDIDRESYRSPILIEIEKSKTSTI